MEAFVEIQIPKELDPCNEQDLRDFFQRACDLKTDFSEALDLECEPRHSHAIVDSVTIMRVEKNETIITIAYSVKLSHFQACNDLTGHWSFDRRLIGICEGNVWKFETHVATPRRSTHEEF